ncbi:hypothetical protein ACIOVF_18965 [Pseudomonas sp. NPDC087612]|uniref:hypothetical protein n=1 Tax=Pseudomonas sp. NPDC087612 TaxID=3364441 RepID=UPI003816C2DA
MSKTIVTFEKNWRGYAAGETAGFDAGVAESLIGSGYAVEAGKPASKKGKAGADGSAPASKKPDGEEGSAPAGKANEQVDESGKP